MGTFCISESGEIITCNCFFDFWVYHVNYQKRAIFRSFNGILLKVSSDDIEEYLGYHSTAMILKKISIFYEGDSPCAVTTICKSCYENSLMRVADGNNISLDEAKKLTSSKPHEMYWPTSKRKKRCDYCHLNGCFSKIMDFLFTTFEAEDFILETSRKCT